MDKFTEFEKHTGDVLKLLDERSKHAKQDVKDTLERIKIQLRKKQGVTFDDNLSSTASAIGAPELKKKPAGEETPLPEPVQLVNSLGVGEPPKIVSNPNSETDPKLGMPETEKSAAGNKEKKPGFLGVLKKRSVITKKLSDEVEENSPK